MNALTPLIVRGWQWAFPMETVPVAEAVPAQVVRAMGQRRWWDHEPRAVARALGLVWSMTDEERWYEEYTRCPACRAWMSARDAGFCQCCLAC